MVIFMVIFSGNSDDEFQSEIAIVADNPNPASEMLLTQMNQLPILDVKSGKPVSRNTAEQWVKDQEVDAAIILPESAEDTSFVLVVNKEDEQGVTTQALSAILDKVVQQANLSAVGATPTYDIQFESVTASTNELDYTDFLLTGMIALRLRKAVCSEWLI